MKLNFVIACAAASALISFQAYAVNVEDISCSDLKTCHELGKKSAMGEGTEKDMAKAYAYFQKAADLGNPESLCSLGNMQRMGLGTERNDEKSLQSFKAAAEKKAPCGLRLLGEITLGGNGVEKNTEQGFSLIRECAEMGDAECRHDMGVLLQNGIGAEKNIFEAVKWYKRAASQGNVNSMGNLAEILLDGAEGVPSDKFMAERLMASAAEAGAVGAMESLGLWHSSGALGTINFEKAKLWLSKACDAGDRIGCEYLKDIESKNK